MGALAGPCKQARHQSEASPLEALATREGHTCPGPDALGPEWLSCEQVLLLILYFLCVLTHS